MSGGALMPSAMALGQSSTATASSLCSGDNAHSSYQHSLHLRQLYGDNLLNHSRGGKSSPPTMDSVIHTLLTSLKPHSTAARWGRACFGAQGDFFTYGGGNNFEVLKNYYLDEQQKHVLHGLHPGQDPQAAAAIYAPKIAHALLSLAPVDQHHLPSNLHGFGKRAAQRYFEEHPDETGTHDIIGDNGTAVKRHLTPQQQAQRATFNDTTLASDYHKSCFLPDLATVVADRQALDERLQQHIARIPAEWHRTIRALRDRSVDRLLAPTYMSFINFVLSMFLAQFCYPTDDDIRRLKALPDPRRTIFMDFLTRFKEDYELCAVANALTRIGACEHFIIALEVYDPDAAAEVKKVLVSIPEHERHVTRLYDVAQELVETNTRLAKHRQEALLLDSITKRGGRSTSPHPGSRPRSSSPPPNRSYSNPNSNPRPHRAVSFSTNVSHADPSFAMDLPSHQVMQTIAALQDEVGQLRRAQQPKVPSYSTQTPKQLQWCSLCGKDHPGPCFILRPDLAPAFWNPPSNAELYSFYEFSCSKKNIAPKPRPGHTPSLPASGRTPHPLPSRQTTNTSNHRPTVAVSYNRAPPPLQRQEPPSAHLAEGAPPSDILESDAIWGGAHFTDADAEHSADDATPHLAMVTTRAGAAAMSAPAVNTSTAPASAPAAPVPYVHLPAPTPVLHSTAAPIEPQPAIDAASATAPAQPATTPAPSSSAAATSPTSPTAAVPTITRQPAPQPFAPTPYPTNIPPSQLPDPPQHAVTHQRSRTPQPLPTAAPSRTAAAAAAAAAATALPIPNMPPPDAAPQPLYSLPPPTLTIAPGIRPLAPISPLSVPLSFFIDHTPTLHPLRASLSNLIVSGFGPQRYLVPADMLEVPITQAQLLHLLAAPSAADPPAIHTAATAQAPESNGSGYSSMPPLLSPSASSSCSSMPPLVPDPGIPNPSISPADESPPTTPLPPESPQHPAVFMNQAPVASDDDDEWAAIDASRWPMESDDDDKTVPNSMHHSIYSAYNPYATTFTPSAPHYTVMGIHSSDAQPDHPPRTVQSSWRMYRDEYYRHPHTGLYYTSAAPGAYWPPLHDHSTTSEPGSTPADNEYSWSPNPWYLEAAKRLREDLPHIAMRAIDLREDPVFRQLLQPPPTTRRTFDCPSIYMLNNPDPSFAVSIVYNKRILATPVTIIDTGANINLITADLAYRLGLVHSKENTVDVVGSHNTVNSTLGKIKTPVDIVICVCTTAATALRIPLHVVPSPRGASWGLLLGTGFLNAIGAIIDCLQSTLSFRPMLLTHPATANPDLEIYTIPLKTTTANPSRAFLEDLTNPTPLPTDEPAFRSGTQRRSIVCHASP